jgi:hypothetical protein
MHRWALVLESVVRELAETETAQAGEPIKLTTEFDVRTRSPAWLSCRGNGPCAIR